MINLKSKHPPQTIRSTDLTPSTDLIVGKYVSNTFCNSANDFLSLSGLHLQRHSRAIVSNSTPSTIVAGNADDDFVTPKAGVLGANAFSFYHDFD